MKFTAEGIAVVEVDNYLSKHIEDAGRLDVAREILLPFQKYIPVGGAVCDVGACLGDYTATFSEFVGPTGKVYAFEPHAPALACLRHNMQLYPNVEIYGVGLGNGPGRANVVRDFHNLGASQLHLDASGGIEVASLDSISPAWPRMDFLKIDAEGFEPMILDGAKETIQRFRPVIVIEISVHNASRLGMGFTVDDIYTKLEAFNYSVPRTDGHDGDILCMPEERA